MPVGNTNFTNLDELHERSPSIDIPKGEIRKNVQFRIRKTPDNHLYLKQRSF